MLDAGICRDGSERQCNRNGVGVSEILGDGGIAIIKGKHTVVDPDPGTQATRVRPELVACARGNNLAERELTTNAHKVLFIGNIPGEIGHQR